MKKVVVFGATALLAAGALGIWTQTSGAAQQRSEAVLKAPDGTSIGKIRFSASRFGFGPTQITTLIDKAPPGTDAKLDALHGLHIHANDDASNGSGCVADASAEAKTWFVSADAHYMSADGKMIGDLPNIILNKQGRWLSTFSTDRFTPSDLVGKVVVLHAGPDNAGNIPVGTGAEQYTANTEAAGTKTAKTGNAGDRIACGVIVAPGQQPASTPPSSGGSTSPATIPQVPVTAAPASTTSTTTPSATLATVPQVTLKSTAALTRSKAPHSTTSR